METKDNIKRKWKLIFERQGIEMQRVREDKHFPVDIFGPIIPQIMEYLPFKDRIALEGTCKTWNFIGKDAGWRDVKTFSTKAEQWMHKDSFYFKLRKTQIKLVLSRIGSTIRKIEFGTEPHNSVSAFQLIMNKARYTIEHVDLTQGVCVVEIPAHLDRIPHLKTLKLGSMAWDLEDSLRNVLGRITSFSIMYNFTTTGEFLKHLNPHLRELIIGGCPHILGIRIMNFLVLTTDLERLNVFGTRDTRVVMMAIADRMRPKLKHLTLSPWYEQLDQDGDLQEMYHRIATRIPNLETLRIPKTEGIPQRTLILMSQGFQRLHTLDISDTNFSEHELTIAAQYMKSITTLILDKPHNLLSFKFLYQLKHLKTLQLKQLPVHKNLETILMYAFHQETLTTLDLREASDLSRMNHFQDLSSRDSPLRIYLKGTDLADLIYPSKRICLGKTILDFST